MLRFSLCGGADHEDIDGIVANTVDANDEPSTALLALQSDVVILCLIEDIRGADAILTALQHSKHDRDNSNNGVSLPSHLLVLSTTMTWANTRIPLRPTTRTQADSPTSPSLSRPMSMISMGQSSPPTRGAGLPHMPSAAGGITTTTSSSRENPGQSTTSANSRSGTFNRTGTGIALGSLRRRHLDPPPEPSFGEDDFPLREPANAFLEHKRLEIAALRLSSSSLSACVVGAGLPYGVGEGPLLRMFREAWRSSDSPIRVPTCGGSAGDNRLAMIHVRRLSAAVGGLLATTDPTIPPPPFSKPYILAVDGDATEPTAREAAAAIGVAFGGNGETVPMEQAELADLFMDDPSALSLLFDVRFSNEDGVLASMAAQGNRLP